MPSTRSGNAGSTAKGNNASKSKKATGNKPVNPVEDDPAYNPVLYKQYLESLKNNGKGSSKAAPKNTKKRARDDEDTIARQKTAKLLEEEEDSTIENEEDEEDGPPVGKKSKCSPLLSDDEQAFADGLSDHGHTYSDHGQQEEEDLEPNMDEDDDQGKDDEGNYTGFDEEDQSNESTIPLNKGNGMSSTGVTPKSTAHRSRYASVGAMSSTTSKDLDVTSTSSTGKVKRSDFPPNIGLLANSAKSLIRTRICFGDWVLESDPERQEWIWDIIKECPATMTPSSKISADQGLQLLSSSSQQVLRSKLITYVGYGKGALFNIIISKARQRVVGHYGLNGSMDTIIEKVDWLMTSSHFIYGNLNLKEKTYDANKPFGNPIIKELIQAIWFNMAKAKADVGTALRMMKESQIPTSIVFLIVSAIEHSIGEYKTGAESQAPFKEMQL